MQILRHSAPLAMLIGFVCVAGADPIEGSCGFKLGEVFQLASTNRTEYHIQPTNGPFTEVVLHVIPSTKTISGIDAIPGSLVSSDSLKAMKLALESKYGKSEDLGRLQSTGAKLTGTVFVIKQDRRQVIIRRDNRDMFFVSYVDNALEAQCKVEYDAIEAAKLKANAEFWKQNL